MKYNAFTLVELLVVVGIIVAVVAAHDTTDVVDGVLVKVDFFQNPPGDSGPLDFMIRGIGRAVLLLGCRYTDVMEQRGRHHHTRIAALLAHQLLGPVQHQHGVGGTLLIVEHTLEGLNELVDQGKLARVGELDVLGIEAQALFGVIAPLGAPHADLGILDPLPAAGAAPLRIGLEELDRPTAGLARDLEDVVGRPEPGVLTGTHFHGVGLPSEWAAAGLIGSVDLGVIFIIR